MTPLHITTHICYKVFILYNTSIFTILQKNNNIKKQKNKQTNKQTKKNQTNKNQKHTPTHARARTHTHTHTHTHIKKNTNPQNKITTKNHDANNSLDILTKS